MKAKGPPRRVGADVYLCRVLLVAVVLSLAPVRVAAITFLGSPVSVTPLNGIRSKFVDQELEFSLGDFGITTAFQVLDPDGGPPTAVTVTPLATEIVSNAAFVGFLPASTSVINSKVFMASDTDAFIGTNLTTPAPPYLEPADQPGGRRLLEALVATADGGYALYPDQDFVLAMCLNALAHGQDPTIWKVCAQGPSASDVSSMQDELQNDNAKIRTFAASLRAANATENTLATQLNRVNAQVSDWENKTVAVLNYTDLYLNRTAEKITEQARVMAVALNQEATSVSRVSSTLANSVGALALLVNATSTRQMQLQLANLQGFSNYMNLLDEYASILQFDYKRDVSVNRFQQQSGLDLITLFQRYLRGDDMKRAQNAQLQSAFEAVAFKPDKYGYTLYPVTLDYGSAPVEDVSTLGPLYNNVPHSDVVVRSITADNPPVGVATRVKYKCEIAFAVKSAPTQPSGDDTVSWLGPRGCDFTWSGPYNRRCQCALSTEESKCVLQNTAGVLSDATIAAWFNASTVVDTTTGCLAIGVPFTSGVGGLDQTGVTSIADGGYTFATIAQRGIYPGTQYNMTSLTRGVNTVVGYSDAMRNASMFMDLAMPSSLAASQNLIFWMKNEWAASFRFTADRIENYRAILDGNLPNGISQQSLLYERMRNGELLTRGTLFSVMLASRETLVLSKVSPSAVLTTVQYTINGVSKTTSDVRRLVVDDELLRKTHFEVLDPDNFESVLVDVPQSEISASPIAGLREGKISLLLSSDPTRLARDAFGVDNGVDLPDRRGSNSPSVYLTALDSNVNSPTYGQCITESLAGFSQGCNVRAHYSAQAFGAFTTPGVLATIIYTRRDDLYRTTLSLPNGPIQEELEAGCPTATPRPSLGLSVMIELTNKGRKPMRIGFVQHGACAAGKVFNDITVAAGATVPFNQAFACLTAPASSPDYITFVYVLDDGVRRPCSARIPLTGGASTTPNQNMDVAPNVNYTISLAGYAVDSISGFALQLEMQLANNSASILSTGSLARRQFAFQMPNSTLDAYAAARAQFAANEAQARNDSAFIQSQFVNLTTLTFPYDDEIAAIRDSQTAARAQSNASLAAAQALYADVQLTIPTLKRVVTAVKAAAPAVIDITRAIADGLIAALKKDALLNSPRWIPSRFDSDDGFSGFVEGAYGVLGMATVDVEDGVEVVAETADAIDTSIADTIANFLKSGLFSSIIVIIVIIAILVVAFPAFEACAGAYCKSLMKPATPRTGVRKSVSDLYDLSKRAKTLAMP